MSQLRKLALRLRNHRVLSQKCFWRAIRVPFFWALDPIGRGVTLKVGGQCTVRIPPEFTGLRWEEFEPVTFRFLRQWIDTHPDSLVLDIGCFGGIFSVAALFASPKVNVVAFDPNLGNLATTRHMTRHATGKRLDLVHGFLASKATYVATTLETAITASALAIAKGGLRGNLHSLRYESLNDPRARSIPSYRLDDLLANQIANDRPMLIKCDVEGAELEVLMGASNTLNRLRPDLILSVHPHKNFGLVQYGHTKTDIENFLRSHGYAFHCIGIDHEEHWACRYQAPTAI
jgi:FkbM family methyltransferase